jgi:hypothetical protein
MDGVHCQCRTRLLINLIVNCSLTRLIAPETEPLFGDFEAPLYFELSDLAKNLEYVS